MRVYLDNSATTRPSERVVQAVARSMQTAYYNPSSLYKPAMEVEKEIASFRAILSCHDHVYFTSGGTEANNIAVFGNKPQTGHNGRILYSAVEHPSVREACMAMKRHGRRVEEIPVTQEGIVDLECLETMLKEDTVLICVMHVNNETGAIQPINEMIALRDRLAPMAGIHVDGVQGFLRVPLDLSNIQSYAISAHKIHGPKGIGALITKKASKPRPFTYGGGQEEGVRSGTENTPGIAGFKEAVMAYPAEANSRMHALKITLYDRITQAIPHSRLNGPEVTDKRGAPHILNMSFTPVRSDTMLYALEGEGVYVSGGSACSSGKSKLSQTLKAMNTPRSDAECAVRFSLSKDTTREEIEYAAEAVIRQYRLFSRYVRR